MTTAKRKVESSHPVVRRVTYTPEELESTSDFVINKPNFCDDDRGATNDLLVVVNSAVTHFEEREAIRQTWGQFAVERGCLLLFLVGSPDPSNPEADLIQEKVFREEAVHGDLLQGAFVENYYNLTLKTISLLRWVNSTCDQIKYIFKVDDDMFVNMQMVVDFCETRSFPKSVIGRLARKWKPHRNPLSKWYVPSSAFNGSIYPNFATGPSYMFSGDAVGSLIKTALSLTPIYLEDVYVTGIVAEKAGVRRLNHALIKNVKLRIDACTFKRFMTSHRHSPQEMLNLWKLVYDPDSMKMCSKPQVQVKVSSSVPSVMKRNSPQVVPSLQHLVPPQALVQSSFLFS
jgi:beta-1,3-galactosyltransferase 1